MHISKLFLSIIGCISWCLLSCVTQEEILLKERSIEKGIEEEKIDHSNLLSSHNAKYADLLEIVEAIKAYIQTTTPLPSYHETNIKDSVSMDPDERKRRIILHALADKLHKETLDLLNEKKNINDFLYKLLTLRFEYLTARNKITTNLLKGERMQEQEILPISPLPTNKLFFDWLIKDENLIGGRERFEHLRIYEVDRYQLLNFLIKETFLKCTLDELKPETIHLLRASAQLHPLLLSDISHEAGHPDEACNTYYTLLSELLIQSTSDNNFPALFKLKSSALQTIVRGGMNLSQNRKPYLNLLYDAIKEKELNEDIQAELATISNHVDVDIYTKHFIKFFEFKGLGVPKGQGIWTYFYEDEHKENYETLPNPAFLRISVPADIEIGNELNKESTSKKESTPEKKKSSKRKNKKIKAIKKKQGVSTLKEPKIEVAAVNPLLTINLPSEKKSLLQQDKEPSFQLGVEKEKGPIAPLLIRSTTTGSTTTGQIEEKETIDNPAEEITQLVEVEKITIEAEKAEKEQKQEENGPKEKEEEDDNVHAKHAKWVAEQRDWSLKKRQQKREKETYVGQQGNKEAVTVESEGLTFLGPTNSRIIRLNQQLFIHTYPIKKLIMNDQGLVNELFDHQKNHDYTFIKFKKIWEIGGGKISKSANGSHYDIFAPQNEPLCGLLRNHGGKSYAPHYVKYLQALARYIGLKPSWEMEDTKD